MPKYTFSADIYASITVEASSEEEAEATARGSDLDEWTIGENLDMDLMDTLLLVGVEEDDDSVPEEETARDIRLC